MRIGNGHHRAADFITMLGASSGGNAQLSMSAIAQIISEYTDSTCTAQVTAGSAQNPYLMEAAERPSSM